MSVGKYFGGIKDALTSFDSLPIKGYPSLLTQGLGCLQESWCGTMGRMGYIERERERGVNQYVGVVYWWELHMYIVLLRTMEQWYNIVDIWEGNKTSTIITSNNN